MPRRATRKKGPYNRAEIQRRYRKRKRREQLDPKTVAKREQRDKRERELAERTMRASEALGMKLYGLLYLDPPWDFLVRNRTTGMDRHAANHYPVMSLAELAELKLPAAKDCILYLWVTVPMLANAMALLSAWRFNYKSLHGWPKPGQGTGHWNRENLELLMVGTRGEIDREFDLLLISTKGRPVAPAQGTQLDAWVPAPRGQEYSEKPEVFAEMIERLWPNTAKLEMFARRRRDGWDSWGNEV